MLELNKKPGDQLTAAEVNQIGAAVDQNTEALNSALFISPEPSEPIEQPEVNTADRAIADEDGNNIKGTYLSRGAQSLTPEQQKQVQKNIGVNDGIVPPGGYNRALYEAVGAVYNEATGYYELNGLTDITEAQMDSIYAYGKAGDIFSTKSELNIRTNLGTNLYYTNTINTSARSQVKLNYFCSENAFVEVACLCPAGNEVTVSNESRYAFYSCGKLKKIIGTMDMGFVEATAMVTFFANYIGCPLLEEVSIKKLVTNVSFAKSPLLSKESILYMIKNSAATSAITVTLHPDAYSMAMADPEIQAALEEKTYVSLASA